jgi:hypothetical protein
MLDQAVSAAITAKPVRTIDDVIDAMRRIDQLLPDADGVKWFNFLYLRVTESVKNNPPASGWEDAQWLERLDVIFANLYFDALVAWARDRKQTARSWRALFDVRRRPDIARLQFALAGMNAHINHDLAIALVQTQFLPSRSTAQYRDFDRVNALLERVEGEVKTVLLTGLIGEVDHKLGRIDDVIALWKVRKARETAWQNAEILWELRPLPPVRSKFLASLDRLVSLSSKGLLAPTI